MMPEKRIYRKVFLLDEKDAINPDDNPENCYRICFGTLDFSHNSDPDFYLNEEEQSKKLPPGIKIKPYERELIENPQANYQQALKKAEDLAKRMSDLKHQEFKFVNLTSISKRKSEDLTAKVKESLPVSHHLELVL